MLDIAATLRASGYAAHLVGGCVRDLFRGVEPADWDLATDAGPDRVQALFPTARYENRFGTVSVPARGSMFEVTTWRSESPYSDHRRPDAVLPAARLEEDLARRDFTVNAMALAVAGSGLVGDTAAAALVDPFGGRADLARGEIRAVGDPVLRFREDALRMLRAVRFAATLDMQVEAGTRAAIRAEAPLAAHVSGERTAAELLKLLAAPRPSRGLALAEETGLLAVVAPELARQRGIPQAKVPGDDLWDHTLRTVDAAQPPDGGAQAVLRLAALVHDIGKPATFADGHFLGHDTVGAELAGEWLAGLRLPHGLVDRVVHLVRHHMFAYDSAWSDAAIRRFIRRVGRGAIEDQLDLRAADNVGSGQAAGVHGLDELRSRCRAQLAAHVALSLGDLALNGTDLIAALGVAPGPGLGALLDRLLERVIGDPGLNDRSRLVALASEIVAAGIGTGAPPSGGLRAATAGGPPSGEVGGGVGADGDAATGGVNHGRRRA